MTGRKGIFIMTIKEIAQLAGVSSAAVSRYLNGGYVSEEKKEQIRKVIEKTGSKSKIVFMPLPKDDPCKRKPDITRASRTGGRE